MAELLKQVILSDIVLFALLGAVMLLITAWAHSTGEYAGYILGWLLGILMSILMSVFSSGVNVVLHTRPVSEGPMPLAGLVAATLAGLFVGFIALALVSSDRYRVSKIRRALAVAVTTGFTLAGGYLMLISGYSTRLVVVVFTMALSIGALLNYIVSFTRRAPSPQATPADFDLPLETAEYPADDVAGDPLDLPGPLAQRIHNLHHRMRRRSEE